MSTTLKVGALSDTEIASHIQNLQSEQTRRSKMREEAQSFLSGSPGRLAVLTSLLPMTNGNGHGQHKAVTKAPKAVKAKAMPTMPKEAKPIRIRYRDPNDSSHTWSGRGRPARWITEAIKAGKAKSKDEFLVA